MNVYNTEHEGDVMATRMGTARIISELRKLILIGELLPGEQLRQEELAQRLGVSRVPLREAFLVLANQGLLNHRPNQGFVVAKRTVAELDQLHRLHTFLETELNASIQWPDDAALEHLKNLNDAMAERIDSDNLVEFIDLNHEFHRGVWKLSPLNVIVAEVERVWSLSDAYFASNYGSAERRRRAVDHHRQIIEALTLRDLGLFQKVSSEHRDDTRGGAGAELDR
ncbi:GntR family transcriptional regulator [Rhodococcus sp. C26F]